MRFTALALVPNLKRLLGLICLILILLAFQNCGQPFQPLNPGSSDSSVHPIGEPSDLDWEDMSQTQKNQKVFRLLANKCSGCHNAELASGGIGDMSELDELVSQNLIVPGNSVASSLYYVIDSDLMPSGGPALSLSEKSLIAIWINELSPPPPPVLQPPQGVGGEYLLIDEDITWAGNNTGVNLSKPLPANFYSPINYGDGMVHFRLNVTSKPDNTNLWLEMCLWNDYLGSPQHSCIHCMNVITKGTLQCSSKMSNGGYDLRKPIVATHHRLKLGPGRGTDLTVAAPSPALPVKGHYTIVIVPKGQAFSGWDKYP